ncbi:hypothetical protein PtA15_5A162 [Puccinia triticina]|uniref:Phospholipid-transporting ATPase n=2 Tax=Puccinia triticina TaxID=208348 RepID=A0ABY7CHJ9_9BASI|nr:uncharacterized protein PtA15_5A162 [Puccinia triticina]WAQ84589.1 hypothetical protein PtA15_5A162 [Puccinia triticina]
MQPAEPEIWLSSEEGRWTAVGFQPLIGSGQLWHAALELTRNTAYAFTYRLRRHSTIHWTATPAHDGHIRTHQNTAASTLRRLVPEITGTPAQPSHPQTAALTLTPPLHHLPSTGSPADILAFERTKPTWITPRPLTSLAEIADCRETHVLLIGDPVEDQLAIIVPISTRTHSASIRAVPGHPLTVRTEHHFPADGGQQAELRVLTGRTADLRRMMAMLVAPASSPADAPARPLAEPRGLGFCTWDSLGGTYNLAQVLGMLDSFADAGMATALDRNHPGTSITLVGVWMTITGYWAGLDPHSELMRPYDLQKWALQPSPASDLAGQHWFLPSRARLRDFWDAYFSFLRASGVDFVKIDNQAGLDRLVCCDSDPSEDPYTYRADLIDLIDELTGVYFGSPEDGGRVLHSMAHSAQILFREKTHGGVQKMVRTSDDFFPDLAGPQGHRWHIHSNAFVSLVAQGLGHVPDFDMTMSRHAWAGFHGCLRAFSGAPVFLTDRHGEHDLLLIDQLTAPLKRGPARRAVVQPRDRSAGAVLSSCALGLAARNLSAAESPWGILKVGLPVPYAAGALIGLWNVKQGDLPTTAVDVLTARDIAEAMHDSRAEPSPGPGERDQSPDLAVVSLYTKSGTPSIRHFALLPAFNIGVERLLSPCASRPVLGCVLDERPEAGFAVFRVATMLDLLAPVDPGGSLTGHECRVQLACLGLVEPFVGLCAITVSHTSCESESDAQTSRPSGPQIVPSEPKDPVEEGPLTALLARLIHPTLNAPAHPPLRTLLSTLANRPLSALLADLLAAVKLVTREFLTLLATCHTVIPEEKDGKIIYQASSPDEAALVAGAEVLNYRFQVRKPQSILIQANGISEEYQVLNILEFNSTRKRMSSIIRAPDGRIILYCKGADTVILERCAPHQPYKESTLVHLEEYATEGLRTLCIAMREIPEEEYQPWAAIYERAAATVNGRTEEIDKASELIEKNLFLLGATAIEDKLQEGVPDTIYTLQQAGIKVWVLTGDRQETAINIGLSCRLISESMNLVIVNEESADATADFIHKRLLALRSASNNTADSEDLALIIDGKSLGFALDKSISKAFLELAVLCKAVVCCRVSPLQKALVVKLVKKNIKGSITLAIGDGANDVSMIQAAHVGIGISGVEGLQAARSADVAISQFRFLKKLLLVHGTWSYVRLTKLILYSFYKNITLYLIGFYFSFANGFSGQVLFESWTLTFYNVLFTVMPPFVLGVLDQFVSARMLDRYPELYTLGQRNIFFTRRIFWEWVATAVYHSVFIFFVTALIFKDDLILHQGWISGQWLWGTTTYLVTLLTVLGKAAIISDLWTKWTLLAIPGSFALTLFILPTYASTAPHIGVSKEYYGLMPRMLSSSVFYFCLLLIPIGCLARDLAWKAYKRLFRPEAYHIVQEIQKFNLPDYRPRMEQFQKAIKKVRAVQRLRRNRGFAFSQTEEGQEQLIRSYDTTIKKAKG